MLDWHPCLCPFFVLEIKLRALIILTYVLVEDTKVWSEIPFDIFDFLLDSINEALLAKDRRIYGCNVTELLDCLTALHGCYHTKSHFLSKNPVPLIMSLMESGSQSEVHAAVKLVWEMSFIEQNRNILKVGLQLIWNFQLGLIFKVIWWTNRGWWFSRVDDYSFVKRKDAPQELPIAWKKEN